MSETSKGSRCVRGFTLVELLVVIGIIAVLISILLPTLNKARESARIVACASNERSIVQMMQIYAAQYRDWLPPFNEGANGYTFNSSQDKRDYSSMGWDAILLATNAKMTWDDAWDITNNDGRAKSFQCPSDFMPRASSPRAPRSYAVNQSKWAYALADGKPGGSQQRFDGTSGAPFEYRMPWSAGCTASGSFPGPAKCLVHQSRLSKVPSHIWLLGENWGQSTVFSLSDTPGINAGGGANLSTAYVGDWAFASLDTSPARFHSTSWGNSKFQPNNAGGNYAYPDGRVEFIKLKDLAVHTPASGNPATYTNPINGKPYNLMENHWEWKAR